MNKKLCIIILAAIVLGFPSVLFSQENFILNGSFEKVSAGLPDFWTTDVWQKGDTVFLSEKEDAFSGDCFVTIKSGQPNDSKLLQRVKVDPDTCYRLSCWIKAYGADVGKKGANITVLGILDTSPDFTDTRGEWEYTDLYVKTGPRQKEMTVSLRLGGYGSINRGTASFDEVRLEQIEDIPFGVSLVNLEKEEPPKARAKSPGSPVSPLTLLIFALLYSALLVGCYLLFSRRMQSKKEAPPAAKKSYLRVFTGILAIGFIFRVILAVSFKGHGIDIGTFTAWALHAANKGLPNFYAGGMFADYPPGYVYVLYLIGLVQKLFTLPLDSKLFLLVLKLPAIIADILISFLIFRYASKKIGRLLAVGISLLFVFNPAVILNSAVWGQVDSVFTLFILVMLLLLIKNRLAIASGIFALAVLIKPQALIFTPLLFFAFIKKGHLYPFLVSMALGLGVFVLGILPFSIVQGPFWIFGQYLKTLASYPYASLNATNLFALFGRNWAPNSGTFLFFSYSTWGLLFILAIVGWAVALFFKGKGKGKGKERYLFVALTIVTAVFVLSTKMHERYLYPALAIGLISFIYLKDKRIFLLSGFLSIIHFLNVGYVFQFSMMDSYQIPRFDIFFLAISFLHLVLLLWLVKLGWDLFIKNKEPLVFSARPQGAPGARFREKIAATPEKGTTRPTGTPPTGQPTGGPTDWPMGQRDEGTSKLAYTKKDLFLLCGVMCVYGVVTLFNLGGIKAPHSGWKPALRGESFIADLGEEQAVRYISTFGGIDEKGTYRIEYSSDGNIWEKGPQFKQGLFTWKRTSVNFSASSIRVIVENPNSTLYEVGFWGFDDEGEHLLPIRQVIPEAVTSLSEGNPESLFDEQEMVPFIPSYYNSMYFDEIYHGRTAYEHIHRLEPFEWTHPPLGKLFIAVGVLLFGMNPFGWRIVGALFGIGMLAAIYVFARSLFKKREYAFFAALLFSVDFLHFTQTRIATIDVYSVFFVILMYHFMYQFYKESFFRCGWRKVVLPLGLCGLFFGLGAASKWTSLYAGPGLAVIFFIVIFRSFKEYKSSRLKLSRKKRKKIPHKERRRIASLVEKYPTSLLAILGLAVCFFIFLPMIIYFLSYIPTFFVPGPGHTISSVWSYQSNMFNYHSGLGATHPFSSKWWTWPLMLKPVWYYGGQDYLPSGTVSSIVAIGNPAIWWVGILAVMASVMLVIKRKDKKFLLVLIGLASQYLPWILIQRLTWIYHFFTSVPFMILCIVYLIKYLKEKWPRSSYFIYGYLAIAVVLFILFYPILSGLPTSKAFVENLRWLKSWIFFT